MAQQKNKHKEDFKHLFLQLIQKISYGAFITDDTIKKIIADNELKITFSLAMDCIRQLETQIGLLHKKRVKRIRNEGYMCLESRVQADTAVREGKEKVQKALKVTARRLDAVNVNDWTLEQQNELLKRTMAIDSLLTIMKNSSLGKKITNKREVEILQETAITTKRLK